MVQGCPSYEVTNGGDERAEIRDLDAAHFATGRAEAELAGMLEGTEQIRETTDQVVAEQNGIGWVGRWPFPSLFGAGRCLD